VTLVLSSAIFAPLFVDPAVAELLGDEAYFRRLLEVEVALARCQAKLGIIPEAAARGIEQAAARMPLDTAALAEGVARDGIPIVALVSLLRQAAGSEAGAFVHWGATSQDIMDTANVLGQRRVLQLLEVGLRELMQRLAALARTHELTSIAARTHGQQALPTSFGLKVAAWASPLPRHLARLRELSVRLCVVSLGGAAGTLAALGPRALELVDVLSVDLGLSAPDLPWHAQRDAVAELGGWLGLVTGSLGKMAQDIILLSQSEVGELSEAAPGQRGGSSSMPQKNNPMQSEQILAAARAVASQQGALLHALVQEQERGTHGWQLEWLSLPPMLALTGGALKNALSLISGLQVDAPRMRHNLLGQHGLVLAEAAVTALCAELPRPEAQALVKTAAAQARQEGRFLIDVVEEQVHNSRPDLHVDFVALRDPDNYRGHSSELIQRVLSRIDAEARARIFLQEEGRREERQS
jgi:3-carboxy-cis,cis-muconate cycloisomerase